MSYKFLVYQCRSTPTESNSPLSFCFYPGWSSLLFFMYAIVSVNNSSTLVLFFGCNNSAVEATHLIVSCFGSLPLTYYNINPTILFHRYPSDISTSDGNLLIIQGQHTSSSESNVSYLLSICIFLTGDKNPMSISSLSSSCQLSWLVCLKYQP
jgi:hypothetical protein